MKKGKRMQNEKMPTNFYDDEQQEEAKQTVVVSAAPRTVDVRVQDGELKPDSLDGMWRMASFIAKSGMVPDHFAGKPEAVLAIIQYANERGLSPMTALNNTMRVNGRISTYGDLFKAPVFANAKRAGIKSIEMWFEDKDGKRLQRYQPGVVQFALVKMAREIPAFEYTAQYSVEEAKRANLWGNTSKRPWISDPEEMLMNRAFGRCAKKVCPELIAGLEGEGYTDFDPELKPQAEQGSLQAKLEKNYGQGSEVSSGAQTDAVHGLQEATK
jgi:hypothetical protein